MHIATHHPPRLRVSAPFLVRVGVDGAVWHPGWVAAMEAVRTGLEAGSLVAVTGGTGVGKSLLLRTLKREFQRAGQESVLLPGEARISTRPVDVVLVDEADRVPADLLHELVQRAPRCVLAGSGKLLATLGRSSSRLTIVDMQPLPPGEIGPYLQQQVERAGWPGGLLTPGAVTSLAHHSAGNPYMLQVLANRALFLVRLEEADQVSATHVDLAAAHYSAASAGSAFDTTAPVRDEPDPSLTDAVEYIWPAPVLLAPDGQQDAAEQGTAPASPPAAVPGRGGAPRSFRLRTLVPVGAICCLALAGAALVSRHGRPPTALVAPAGDALPLVQQVADRSVEGFPPPAAPQDVVAGDGSAAGTPPPIPGAEQRGPDMAEAVPTSDAAAPAMADGAGQADGYAAVPGPPAVVPPEPGMQLPGSAPPGVQIAGAGTGNDAQPPAPSVPASAPAGNNSGIPEAAPLPQVAAARPAAVPQPSGTDVRPSGERVAALQPPPLPAPASLSRPAMMPLHVVVAVARHDPAAESRGASLVNALEGDGVQAVIVPVQPASKEPAVVYFYPSDQPAAAHVARRIGEDGHERLVAPRGVPPRPGTVQVSIPSGHTPARSRHEKS